MAKLSFDRPFQEADILEIRPLTQQQPVWLMTGEMESSIVIKAESQGERSSSVIKTIVEVMSVVSPGGQMKKLENIELNALRKWVYLAKNVDDGMDSDFTRALSGVQTALDNPMRVMMKMETLKLITLDSNDEKAAKKIGKALNYKGGLEDMGKIIAADMFNGNSDRFNFSNIMHPGGGTIWGTEKTKLKYLMNIGNIMIREDGNEAKLVGMDPFDNSSQSGGLGTMSNNEKAEWPYRIFHPSTRVQLVRQIADLCAEDLREVIGKKRGIINLYRLSGDAGSRIARGMNEGADLIENHFRQKYGKPNCVVPLGFPDRAQIAGWTWFAGNTTNMAFGGLNRSRRN